MKSFRYHEGQRAVQHEANSIQCADKLSRWVGPVAAFTAIADLIILASPEETGIRSGATADSSGVSAYSNRWCRTTFAPNSQTAY